MTRIDPFSPIETRRIADEALLRAKSGGGGGGGITQLLGDVLAGPGSGAVTATVARINGATVPAAGALTTGNVLQVTGASALGYGPVNLALSAAVTGLLAVANIAPGSAAQVLTTTGGVAVWATPSGGSGITQLTGDVTAGPGSGSQAATVARINGATVPAAGALTTGNGLYVTGASALGYSALNLAGGANYVTGLLPVGNIAPAGTNGFVLTTTGGVTVWAAASGGSGITQLTGDVLAGPGSGSQAATVASAQNGGYAFQGNGDILWQQSYASPGFSQTPSSGATGANFTIAPQNGTATGGNLVVNLMSPIGLGTEALFQVNRGGGEPVLQTSAYPSVSTIGVLWLGDVSPAIGLHTIYSNGATTEVNATTELAFAAGGAIQGAFYGNGFQLFGAGSADFGGGVGVLGVSPATTIPTALPISGGVVLFAYTGIGLQALGVDAQAVIFPTFITSPVIAQETVAATNGQTLGIAAQGVSSGTGNGGVLSLAGGSPSGGGLNGAVQLMTQGLAGIVLLAVGNYGLTLGQESLAVASTGTTTLTAAQYQWPEQNVSAVALTGAITIVLPNQQGLWIFDFSAVTGISGVNTITFQSGSATSSPISSFATLGIGSMVFVKTTGANGINVK